VWVTRPPFDRWTSRVRPSAGAPLALEGSGSWAKQHVVGVEVAPLVLPATTRRARRPFGGDYGVAGRLMPRPTARSERPLPTQIPEAPRYCGSLGTSRRDGSAFLGEQGGSDQAEFDRRRGHVGRGPGFLATAGALLARGYNDPLELATATRVRRRRVGAPGRSPGDRDPGTRARKKRDSADTLDLSSSPRP